MSHAAARPKGFSTRAAQAFGLFVVFGLLWAAAHYTSHERSTVVTVGALGFLLMGGTLASELLEPIGIPHLTGYLAVGILAGPNVLHLIDHETVESLSSINGLALALIAFEGGAELKIDLLKKGLKSLAVSTLLQHTVVLVVMAGVFMLARPIIPFAKALPTSVLVGVALLWGVLATTRSPSATLGILSQTRANGPLARFTLAFVMTSDVMVVVLAALGITIARSLVDPNASFSSEEFVRLGHEMLGSVSLGTTLGLLIVVYLRFVGRQFLLVVIALGFGFTEILKYLGLEPLLTFMVAGFLVQNLSKQGEKFLHGIQDTGSVVYVVFFATAGAHLNIPLLKKMWVVALVLFVARLATSVGVSALASRIAGDPPVLRRWAWSGLVSQAGLALGVAALIANAFPGFGPDFRSLAIASVAVNEMVGPILFKLALDRGGETSGTPESVRADLHQGAPPEADA